MGDVVGEVGLEVVSGFECGEFEFGLFVGLVELYFGVEDCVWVFAHCVCGRGGSCFVPLIFDIFERFYQFCV